MPPLSLNINNAEILKHEPIHSSLFEMNFFTKDSFNTFQRLTEDKKIEIRSSMGCGPAADIESFFHTKLLTEYVLAFNKNDSILEVKFNANAGVLSSLVEISKDTDVISIVLHDRTGLAQDKMYFKVQYKNFNFNGDYSHTDLMYYTLSFKITAETVLSNNSIPAYSFSDNYSL